jgi:DNA-directed RNA polymerase specialized sigma24 family protein
MCSEPVMRAAPLSGWDLVPVSPYARMAISPGISCSASSISLRMDEPSKPAMEQLVRRYWPAIFAYIRAAGSSVEQAADLTQGFVCDVVLGRNLFSTADQMRGRFRSLLATSLRNYLHQQHRDEVRQKRSPHGQTVIAMDADQLANAVADPSQSPEQAFNTQWMHAMVRQVTAKVRGDCMADGLDPHWKVFEARVVHPMLNGTEPASYQELVDRLDLEDPAQAANMMITIKRRFARAMLDEIEETVSGSVHPEDELNDLLREMER